MQNKKLTIATSLLERYLCGEATVEERQMVEEACESNDAIRAQLDALKQSNKAVSATNSADNAAPAIGMKMHGEKVLQNESGVSKSTSCKKVSFWIPLRSISFVVILLFGIPMTMIFVNKRLVLQEGTRIKGQKASLSIYREMDNGFKKLPNYAPATTDDRLQIGYRAAGKKYGVIFSVDGNGVLVVHFPEDREGDEENCTLEQGGEKLLQTSFVLDSAPLFERFYFLTSDSEINVADVISKCKNHFREGGAHVAIRIRSLPKTIEQTTFSLKKD